MRGIGPILIAVSLTLAAPLRAADPPKADAVAVEEAKRHFAEGQRLFERGELKPAVEELKEAYRLTRNALLLYNIALVYDKLGDEPIALHYYGKFVDEAQDSDRTHAQLTEASSRAAALKAKLAQIAQDENDENDEPPATQPTETPPAQPPTMSELVHEPVDQAPPGQPIDVTVRVPKGTPWTVTLHYRAPGQDLYQSVTMKPRAGAPSATVALGEELIARVPAAAVRGGALHYHIAARDPEGKLVGFSGKPQTPNIVYLDEKAPPHHYLDPGLLPPTGPVGPPPEIVRVPRKPIPPLTWAKWATTGGAAVLIGTSIAFNLLARSYSDTLEDEAIKSSAEECDGGPPCRIFSVPRKDLESIGQGYETWANVTILVGGAAAAAAGVLWYLDSRPPPVMPIVGPGFSGAILELPF